MEIRKITADDTERFVEFYKNLTDETDYLMFTKDEVEELEEEEKEFIKNYDEYKQAFIAIKDEEIVGFLGIKRSHLEKIKHNAKIVIAVLSEYHRSKIATRLLEYAEKWAKENKIKRIEADIITENDAAIELFKKAGYKQECIRHNVINLDDEYLDEYTFAKEI